MLSIQQLIKALKRLQNNTTAGGDLVKSIKHVALCANNNISESSTTIPTATTFMTSLSNHNEEDLIATSLMTGSRLPEQQTNTNSNCVSSSTNNDTSSQLHLKQHNCQTSHNECFSFYSPLNVDGSKKTLCREDTANVNTQDSVLNQTPVNTTTTTGTVTAHCSHELNHIHHHHQNLITHHQPQRSQRIQNFFQQQLFHHNFHTQHNQNLNTKQKQTQFAMSSLAAEPLALQKSDDQNVKDSQHDSIDQESSSASSSSSSAPASCPDTNQQNSAKGKPCFNTGLADILQFMELIGNLKHTKRTGWVLRGVDDCESISGHMYRMSMLTFLLDGTEGLNQIRCMELALVHDLAESLVGDITPFCGITKDDKKAMELKAMEDICKLIEPRGKRMMELFEEYENAASPESRFVKDLDRLDMVMQAFEYEKRDNCLLKHQEFFDSTEGKFNHPFVKKLVNEIYEQREQLAKVKGATPPPKIIVPTMESSVQKPSTANGHCSKKETIAKSTETSESS